MNFNLLILPLVYSTLASAVTPEKLGSFWFVLVSAIVVICVSYAVATLLGKLLFKVDNKVDFDALRIAAAFPNIVALPILLFPTLCEFPVVYNGFYEGQDGSTVAEKLRSCVDQSNAMIFIYFFGWNLLYWIVGYPTLVAAGQKRQTNNEGLLSRTEPHLPVDSFKSEEPEVKIDVQDKHIQRSNSRSDNGIPDEDAKEVLDENQPKDEHAQSTIEARTSIQILTNALIQTFKSTGFIGSALESLGKASSSVGTLVVAASLVHQATDDENAGESHDNECATTELGTVESTTARKRIHGEESTPDTESVQHHSKDLRASMRRRRSSISQMSSKAMAAIRRRKPTILGLSLLD